MGGSDSSKDPDPSNSNSNSFGSGSSSGAGSSKNRIRNTSSSNQGYRIGMTNNSVCVFLWYSNWLGTVQMVHADRAVFVCFVMAWLMYQKWSKVLHFSKPV